MYIVARAGSFSTSRALLGCGARQVPDDEAATCTAPMSIEVNDDDGNGTYELYRNARGLARSLDVG
jgi:hypothetical protein